MNILRYTLPKYMSGIAFYHNKNAIIVINVQLNTEEEKEMCVKLTKLLKENKNIIYTI